MDYDEKQRLLDHFAARIIQALGPNMEASTVVTRTLIAYCDELRAEGTKPGHCDWCGSPDLMVIINGRQACAEHLDTAMEEGLAPARLIAKLARDS